MTDLLARLTGVEPSGDGWTARCPAHEDRHNSLSVHHRDGHWLVKCHAGCNWQAITDALGMNAADLFDDDKKGGGGFHLSNNRATAQPTGGASASQIPGLTLDRYATLKGLPIDFLKTCGLSEFTYDHKPAVRIPYFGIGEEELAVRFRIALDGDRFRWKSGTKPCLYGLNRLAEARQQGQVALVEGESDCHTLWLHGIPAIGIPGAANWREERDARHLDGIDTIYVVVEPDRGGDAVKQWLSRSTIRHRAKLVTLPTKDPSALHLQGADEFARRWQVACLGAVPWIAIEAQANAEEHSDAWEKCSALAQEPKILDRFAIDLSRIGVVGERRAAKIIYLAKTSRLLDRPVSVAIKGPSSGGKSFVVESTLRFFPPDAFYALTAMSDRALAYSNEPLKHRHLVLYELHHHGMAMRPRTNWRSPRSRSALRRRTRKTVWPLFAAKRAPKFSWPVKCTETQLFGCFRCLAHDQRCRRRDLICNQHGGAGVDLRTAYGRRSSAGKVAPSALL
jgi:hypothetical protein